MVTLLKTPQVHRRYILQDVLGRGGMGIVYQALDRLTGEQVAFKRVLAPGEEMLVASSSQRVNLWMVLAQEFQILASLRHPNIVGVLDYGFDSERQSYFTMDLLHQPRTIAETGLGQPLDVQIDLLVQLLRSLVYLHQRQILHRDLKPNNVLVEQGMVKVVDFGLSLDRERPVDEVLNEVGTLPYMAPELVRQEMPTVSSDLYAVGVIAYEMFAGKRPFDATSLVSLTQKILSQPAHIEELNLSPALAQVVDRLLAKTPEERYGSAAEVIQALHDATGHALPVETKATRESFLQASKFIGRQPELAALSEALKSAIQGVGSTTLIGGESGVGKSRLLHELKTKAQVQGVVVLSGQAVTESTSPYQLWQDFLRWLVILVDLSDDEASVFKDLVPDIARLVGREVANAPALDPQTTQERLRSTISAVLKRQSQPLLLIVEDLQWAYDQDLSLLSHLNKLAPELPLLILGNYRDEERPTLPDQLSEMQYIKLNRLSESEIIALGQSMLGDSGHQTPVIDLLVNQTEGNVFFLVEVVRVLAEQAGQLDKVGGGTLPTQVFTGGIQQIVQLRLNHVSAADRPLLQIAAIAGRQIDLRLMSAFASEDDLERWLSACAAVAVLEVQDARWRFAHDKLREGLLLSFDETLTRDLNRQVAQAIEQTYPDLNAQSGRLAYHWGMAGDLAAEARYALIAAGTAHRFHARQEATAYYTQAIDALAKLPDSIENRRSRVDAIIRRTEISLTIVNTSLHLQHLSEAEALARTLPSDDGDTGGDRRRLAHVQLWIGNIYFGQNKMLEASQYYRDVLVVGQAFQDDELIALPAGVLGRALGVQGRYREAEPLLNQAHAPLAKLGHWHQWMLTMVVLGLTKVGQGHCAEGMALFPIVLERAQTLTDYLAQTVCYTTPCALHLMMRQNYDQAAQSMYELIDMLKKLKDPTAHYLALGYTMWVESRRGNHQIAADLLAQAHDIIKQVGALLLNDTFMYAEAELAFNAGRFDEALTLTQSALEAAVKAGSLLNQVRVHRLIGQTVARLDPADGDKIDTHFSTALTLSEANNMRLEAADIHSIWGQLLADRGKQSDALDHWWQALTQFDASDLLERYAQVRQQIDSLG